MIKHCYSAIFEEKKKNFKLQFMKIQYYLEKMKFPSHTILLKSIL